MIIRQRYNQNMKQKRYNFHWILLSILLLRIEICISSTSSFLGMDASTLRSLGISESEIESILAEEEGYNTEDSVELDTKAKENEKIRTNRNNKDDYSNYESGSTSEEDEEEGVGDGSESAWWKDPLARFENEDLDEEYDEEITSNVGKEKGVMPDERNEPISPPISSEKDETEIEDTEEDDDSQEGLSNEAKERLAKSAIVMAEDYPTTTPQQNKIQKQQIQKKQQQPRTISPKKSTSKLVAAPALPIIFLHRQAPALKIFMGVAMVQFLLNLFFGKAKDAQDLATNDDDDEDTNELKPKERSMNLLSSQLIQNPFKTIFRNRNKQYEIEQQLQEEMSKREASLQKEIQNWKTKAISYKTEMESISNTQSQTQSEYNLLLKKQNQLTSIIKHLKRELSSMEERIDDAVQNERSKANDELRNVREAMMKILVKERKLMKMEMKKNNDKVRALLLKQRQRDEEDEL